MDVQQVETVIRNMIKSGITLDTSVYMIILLITIVGGLIGGLLRTYTERRLQNIATKHDFQEILRQLERTTKTTEDIKAESGYVKAYMEGKGQHLATKEDFNEIFRQFKMTEDYKVTLQKDLGETQAKFNADLQKSIYDHQEKIKSDLLEETKEIELRLTRRSSFVEKILLDKYQQIRDLEYNIEMVATNLNRLKNGGDVPSDFIVNGDIVPLTKIFEQLEVYKYLLGERFYVTLTDQCQLLIKIANESHPEILDQMLKKYHNLRSDFQKAMNDIFKIDQIIW